MDWHVHHEVVVVANFLENVLDGEPIIMRDRYVLEGVAPDVLLLAADQVLQKAGKGLEFGEMTY